MVWAVRNGICLEPHEVAVDHYGTKYVREMMVKLAAYEDAEEQGMLVALPCMVGDTVWTKEPFEDKHIREGRIVQINIDAHGFCCFWVSFHPGNMVARFIKDNFGKTVFLTREEAEKALEEMG